MRGQQASTCLLALLSASLRLAAIGINDGDTRDLVVSHYR
jgi:hypothetical protein